MIIVKKKLYIYLYFIVNHFNYQADADDYNYFFLRGVLDLTNKLLYIEGKSEEGCKYNFM